MPGARADAARIDGLLREIRLVRALSGTDVPARGADRRRRHRHRARHAVLRHAGDRRVEPDGRRVASAVRHRPARPGAAWRSSSSTAPPSWAGWIGAPRASTASAARTDSTNGRSIAGWPFSTPTRCATFPAWTRPPTGCATTGPRTTQPGIMHGDYQFANVMFAHGEPARLAAIVDWEMTTVGDPLLDLAWALLGYDGEDPRADGFYLDMRGMPTRSELLEHYENGQRAFHREHRLLPGAGQLETRHRAGEDLCRRGAHRKSRSQDHRTRSGR